MNYILEREIREYKNYDWEIISMKNDVVLFGKDSAGFQFYVRSEEELTKDHPEYTWISACETVQTLDFEDNHRLFFDLDGELIYIECQVRFNRDDELTFDCELWHIDDEFLYGDSGLAFVRRHKDILKNAFEWYKETLLTLQAYRIHAVTSKVEVYTDNLIDQLYVAK
jgi:hypothetical protein